MLPGPGRAAVPRHFRLRRARRQAHRLPALDGRGAARTLQGEDQRRRPHAQVAAARRGALPGLFQAGGHPGLPPLLHHARFGLRHVQGGPRRQARRAAGAEVPDALPPLHGALPPRQGRERPVRPVHRRQVLRQDAQVEHQGRHVQPLVVRDHRRRRLRARAARARAAHHRARLRLRQIERRRPHRPLLPAAHAGHARGRQHAAHARVVQAHVRDARRRERRGARHGHHGARRQEGQLGGAQLAARDHRLYGRAHRRRPSRHDGAAPPGRAGRRPRPGHHGHPALLALRRAGHGRRQDAPDDQGVGQPVGQQPQLSHDVQGADEAAQERALRADDDAARARRAHAARRLRAGQAARGHGHHRPRGQDAVEQELQGGRVAPYQERGPGARQEPRGAEESGQGQVQELRGQGARRLQEHGGQDGRLPRRRRAQHAQVHGGPQDHRQRARGHVQVPQPDHGVPALPRLRRHPLARAAVRQVQGLRAHHSGGRAAAAAAHGHDGALHREHGLRAPLPAPRLQPAADGPQRQHGLVPRDRARGQDHLRHGPQGRDQPQPQLLRVLRARRHHPGRVQPQDQHLRRRPRRRARLHRRHDH
mmetsp:Transcript_210/g.418  ORF Transcript_210/g.418 Transcript_210/m.418 type:complete len:593 (+) Transcript_210:142-1920(+)